MAGRLRRFHKRLAKRLKAVVDCLQAQSGTLFKTVGDGPRLGSTDALTGHGVALL
ncbi:MAG: hypothetical protein LBD24_06520 [Spirochaetaceae bacterium]|nr:hypothetical protein [Spirochaetaceae bacterium]